MKPISALGPGQATLVFPTPERACEWLCAANERHGWVGSAEVCQRLLDGLRALDVMREPTMFLPLVGLRLPAYLTPPGRKAG